MITNKFSRPIHWIVLASLLFASLAGVAAPARAAGAVLYLAPTGADAGSCTTSAQPCKTVQYAIDQASSGDELHLAAGTFNTVQTVSGRTQIANVEKNLIIMGGYNASFSSRSPATTPTILDAAGAGRVVYVNGAVTATLDGIQMKNGSAYGSGGCVYASGGAALTITDSLVSGCQTTGGGGLSHTGGGLYAYDSQVNISSSEFNNNINSGSGTAEGGAIYLRDSDAVIDGVTFTGNQTFSTTSGYGGAINTQQGALELKNSTFSQNSAAYGGAIYLRSPDSVLEDNTFEDNTAGYNGGALYLYAYWAEGSAFTGNHFEGNHTDYEGGAVYIYEYREFTFTDNEFIDNTARKGAAVYTNLEGAESSASSLETFTGNLFDGNQATNDGGAIYYTGAIDFLYNQFIDNHSGNDGGAIYQDEEDGETGQAVFDGNLLRGNSTARNGGALVIATSYNDGFVNVYRNSAFIDNTAGNMGGAIYMYRYTNTMTNLQHLTFTGNSATGGSGASLYINYGTVTLSNSLFSDAALGVYTEGKLTLAKVLFDQASVTTPVTNPYWALVGDDRVTGAAGLDADNYHLTDFSAAIDAGSNLSLTYDIDKDPRSQGSAPDLGADESPYTAGESKVQAQLNASAPEWKLTYETYGEPPKTTLEQTYMAPYGNYSDSLSVTGFNLDFMFPSALDLVWQNSSPALTYSAAGDELNWISTAGLAPGKTGWVGVTGTSPSLNNGSKLTASGTFSYTLSDESSDSIELSAETVVPTRPVFPPLIVTPWSGEMCLDGQNQLTATGLASNNVTVNMYENNKLVGSVPTEDDGAFKVTWNSALTPEMDVDIYAVSCEDGGSCSEQSEHVLLDYPKNDWCPQRSYWEGDVGSTHYTFHFRNDRGDFTTEGFLIPGIYGFWNTKLHLFSCCEDEKNPFRVTADEQIYENPSGHNGREWIFDIQQSHQVMIQTTCSGKIEDGKVSAGEVLIDPDGFVFDQSDGGSYHPGTGMFDPTTPLSGFTVTAYQWVEEWGTWIRWPAEMYDNQVNPQVTGSNGYYAFFTPPGTYYLQTTGKNGYQTWRSPEIEVVADLVHMNSPMTSSSGASSASISSSPAGLSQANVSIATGQSVTWKAALNADASISTLQTFNIHPGTRLLSSQDPLIEPAGWDSGMLLPGAGYQRTFNLPGIFTYTDGFGHTGTITVSGAPIIEPSLIFLPGLLK